GDNPIAVHPLMPDCRDYFIFDSNGGIRPSGADPVRVADALRTIETLGLDIPKLVAQRRAAIEGALTLLGDDEVGEEELRRLVAGFDGKNAQGQCTPFASAVVQVLSAYMPP
ncbi:MAG TPA: hypothetical protein VE153_09025, partial [Myxococcus sp.]|nr:hypothetical protein [Myxococcus sp.]